MHTFQLLWFKKVRFSRLVLTTSTLLFFVSIAGCSHFYLLLDYDQQSNQLLHDSITTIAFGSCNNQAKSTQIWDKIIDQAPDLFVWTGDIIYPDWPIPLPGNTLTKIEHKYSFLKNRPDYKKFCAQVPVVGIYDDHDYGKNNGGKDFEFKAESRELLFKFLDEPIDSERRNRSGAFVSYNLGKHGQIVKLILLDTRFNRDKPGEDADILGEEQWLWLTDELEKSEAEVTIIVSSYSILSKEVVNEGWHNYPAAKARLLKLFATCNPKGLVLVGGDKHFAELNEDKINEVAFYELIASGITHWEHPGKNYRNGITETQQYLGINFGSISINWQTQPITITMQIINEDGKPVLQKSILDETILANTQAN